MYRYGGKVIHQSQDTLGSIEVVENGYERSLHFGSEPRQSTQDLHNPQRLALSYTRAMMSSLLFSPEPQHILLIGLGGGSLAKFLLQAFSRCHIVAVEFREAVADVAHSHFGLPHDPRLTLHIDDGAHFVRNHRHDGPFDLILIDAFVDNGMATTVCNGGFFDDCHALLAPQGTLAMNLWSNDEIGALETIDELALAFAGQVLKLPVEGKENIVALATCAPALLKRLRKLDPQARLLQQQHGIEFPAFLKALRKNNRRFFF